MSDRSDSVKSSRSNSVNKRYSLSRDRISVCSKKGAETISSAAKRITGIHHLKRVSVNLNDRESSAHSRKSSEVRSNFGNPGGWNEQPPSNLMNSQRSDKGSTNSIGGKSEHRLTGKFNSPRVKVDTLQKLVNF